MSAHDQDGASVGSTAHVAPSSSAEIAQSSDVAAQQGAGTHGTVPRPCVRDYVRWTQANARWFDGVIDDHGHGPELLYGVIRVKCVSAPPPVLDDGAIAVGDSVLITFPGWNPNLCVVARSALAELKVDGETADMPLEAGTARSRRDCRLAVAEAVGCALAALRRNDHVWCDEDVRETLRQVRSALSVAQSKIKERIDE
jgi:hypothetical protein